MSNVLGGLNGTDWGALAAWTGISGTAMWRIVKTTMKNVVADYMTSTKIAETLAAHDTALALLIQQVIPPNQKSLRDLLQEIMLQQAATAGATTTLAQATNRQPQGSP